ncbi:MAG: EthD family reductase [Usitatibacter sp.]
MAKLLALYKHPQNPAHFEAYYYGTHVPLAKTVAGLRRYEVSTGPVATPQGTSQYHLIAELTFDSIAAIGKALASSEGQATGADLANFATGGVDLLVFDTTEL